MWDLCTHWENYIHSASSLFGIHYSSFSSCDAVQLCHKMRKEKKFVSRLRHKLYCPNCYMTLCNFYLFSPPKCSSKCTDTFKLKFCSLTSYWFNYMPKLSLASPLQNCGISARGLYCRFDIDFLHTRWCHWCSFDFLTPGLVNSDVLKFKSKIYSDLLLL